MIGLLLEREPMKTGQWLGLIGSVMAGGWITSLVVVTFLGFQINPPRNNSSITFFGAALAQLIWLACNGKWVGFRGGLLGYLGFGLGMAGGRLLGNIAHVMQASGGFTINHWNVMEVSCGLIGGFIYCFGMLGRTYPPPPQGENIRWTSALSMIYVLGLIPLWHRLSRIESAKKLEEWGRQLQSYGYAEPQQLAETILSALDGVCVLGFVGAAIWMLIHFRRWERLAWFPVLWLSFTMLLFQNLSALYFFYPRVEKQVNMHSVFWLLFAGMALYVIATSFIRPEPIEDPPLSAVSVEPPVPWLRWLVSSGVALAAIVFVAGFVNGEATMRSANTRWPVWAWTEGPFPGKNAVPEAAAETK
jgi:hypothetical protein